MAEGIDTADEVHYNAQVGDWWDRLAPRNRLLLLSAIGLGDYRYNCLYQWSRVSQYIQELVTTRVAKIVIAFERSQPPGAPELMTAYLREFPLHPEQKH